MRVVIICPQCGAVSKGRDDLVGKTVRCPKCAKAFTAPPEELQELEVVTPSPPPPASKSDTVDQSVKCPSCNTHDVKKVSLVYEQETKNVDVSTEAMGVGVGTGGVSVFGGSVPTQGKITSQLAQRLQPPPEPQRPQVHKTIKNKSFGHACASVIFATFCSFIALSSLATVLWILLRTSSNWTFFFPGFWYIHIVLSIVFSLVMLSVDLEAATKIHNEETIKEYDKSVAEINKWKHSWICNRCGHVFQP